MFDYIYYWLFFPAQLRSERGIAAFADLVAAAIIRRYVRMKKTAAPRIRALQQKVLALLVEREVLADIPAMEHGERVALQQSVSKDRTLYRGAMLAEALLNYISFRIIITGAALIFVTAAAALAGGLTFGSAKMAEHFFTNLLRPIARTESEVRDRASRLVFLAIVVIVFEAAIVSVATVRAHDIEDGAAALHLIGWGLIALSAVLPIAAGYLKNEFTPDLKRLHQEDRRDAVARELELRKKSLIALRHKLEAHFEKLLNGYWSRLLDFVSVKEAWNRKHGISESTAGTYYESRDSFTKEMRRQRAELHDETQLKEAVEMLESAAANGKPAFEDEARSEPNRLILTR